MSNLSETKDGEWLVSSPSLRPLNYYKILNELSNENTKLKELLKECKYELRGCYTDIGWEDQSLINKIDQALGEE